MQIVRDLWKLNTTSLVTVWLVSRIRINHQIWKWVQWYICVYDQCNPSCDVHDSKTYFAITWHFPLRANRNGGVSTCYVLYSRYGNGRIIPIKLCHIKCLPVMLLMLPGCIPWESLVWLVDRKTINLDCFHDNMTKVRSKYGYTFQFLTIPSC